MLGEKGSGVQEHAQEVQQIQEELAHRSASLSGVASDNQQLKAQPSGLSLDLTPTHQHLSQAQVAFSQAAQVCLVWPVYQYSHLLVHVHAMQI